MQNKTPNFDAKMKTLFDELKPGERKCELTGETFELTQEDIERYRKWNVPPSTFSEFSRMRILSAWGAGVDLWWKPHFVTGKPILCSSHPDSVMPVVTDMEYFSKDWGEEVPLGYDSNKSLFQQQKELFESVPQPAFQAHGSENCVGGGYLGSVNSFMLFGTYYSKDSFTIFRCRNTDRCMDGVFLENCSDTYSSSMAVRTHGCTQVFDSLDCINSSFLFDCRNCEDCFGATNARRKKFIFMNEQLSEGEYKERISKIDLSCTSTFEEYKKKFHELLRRDAIWPEHFNINSEGCEGNYLLDCRNTSGFFCTGSLNVKNSQFVFESQECEDVVIGNDSQDVYNTCVSLACQNTKNSWITKFCSSVEYCAICDDCEFCFGCVGLQKKKYCILNKQYTEDEYWKKLDEIKCAMLDRGEYGRFWSMDFANWGANIGFGSLTAPLTPEEIHKLGGELFNLESGIRYAPYKDAPVNDVNEVPDCISDISSENLGVTFYDEKAGRRFNVGEREYKFRAAHGYPFPREHYRGRLIELIRQVGNLERESSSCDKCSKQFMTSKNLMFPDRKVYCYECYLDYLETNG